MITAIDTSVLFDVFRPDPVFGPRSKKTIKLCRLQGRLIACDVVWAEAGGFFGSSGAAKAVMETIGVEFNALDLDAALAASVAWKSYRNSGGKRERMIADFLVGAHALCLADRLLTRDRGFYRAYFSSLRILDPAKERP